MGEPQAARMWGTYEFGGHRVTVTQQWRDPFGRSMVRIQTTGPGPEQAMGLPGGRVPEWRSGGAGA